ncbi:hypothetical protein [Sphingomonas sp. T9W2]|uniref:hypothetical protein n=1 Tax=Sphingomonas sp. T9W2 TaxID=3143183 RepID=UPI0031F538D0
MAPFSDSVRDQYNRPVLGATIHVFTQAGALATLYTESGGPLANPILVDALGNYSFYADDAKYRREIRLGSRLLEASDIIVGDPPEYVGKPGDPGPAGNVAATLDQLKAAPITNVTMIYDGDTWVWTALDYTGLADDAFVVKSDDHPLSEGAWVRQIDRITVIAAGGKGDGGSDESDAVERAVAAVKATGGTIVFGDAPGYRLTRPMRTLGKRIAIEIGITTVYEPRDQHGLIVERNGCTVRGTSPWGSILKKHPLTAAPVMPVLTPVIVDGKIVSITATGGSGFLTNPVLRIENSPANADISTPDASAIATIAGGTIASIAVVAQGSGYDPADPPTIEIVGGGPAGIYSAGIQDFVCENVTFDHGYRPHVVGLYQFGGWWGRFNKLNDFYTVATGFHSLHPTAISALIMSTTLGAPGPNGSYDGAYVNRYAGLAMYRVAMVGKDTSTVTTAHLDSCDIKERIFQACICITETNPVAQAPFGSRNLELTNVDGLTWLGGDMEDAGIGFKFMGACNNIVVWNTVTYAASGPRFRGMAGTGSIFKFAESNSTREPLHIGSAGSAGAAWQNVGWRQLHRQGIQYRGDTWVDSTNVKLFLGTSDVVMGNLDDTSAPGSAMVRRGSQMEYYTFSPGANPRTGALFGVWNNDGISIGGAVGLQVGGTRVVKPRQAALPPAATDLATAITLLNALRAGVIASTGHGLFEG